MRRTRTCDDQGLKNFMFSGKFCASTKWMTPKVLSWNCIVFDKAWFFCNIAILWYVSTAINKVWKIPSALPKNEPKLLKNITCRTDLTFTWRKEISLHERWISQSRISSVNVEYRFIFFICSFTLLLRSTHDMELILRVY